MKKCKVCNCSSESDFCFRHKERRPMPKISKKKTLSLIDAGKPFQHDNNLRMERNNLFFLIWQERPHKSEVSFTDLGKEPLTIYFHHILEKEKFPQAEFDKQNIILLTWEEHDQVGMDMYRYPEINKRRELLKIKYNL